MHIDSTIDKQVKIVRGEDIIYTVEQLSDPWIVGTKQTLIVHKADGPDSLHSERPCERVRPILQLLCDFEDALSCRCGHSYRRLTAVKDRRDGHNTDACLFGNVF